MINKSMKIYEVTMIQKRDLVSIAEKICEYYESDMITVDEYSWLVRQSKDERIKFSLAKANSINVLDITSHKPQENLLRDAKSIKKASEILRLIDNELNLRTQRQG